MKTIMQDGQVYEFVTYEAHPTTPYRGITHILLSNGALEPVTSFDAGTYYTACFRKVEKTHTFGDVTFVETGEIAGSEDRNVWVLQGDEPIWIYIRGFGAGCPVLQGKVTGQPYAE